MNYQWYPGHMTKAKRQMQEDIKLIDIVVEITDARIPLSSRNPDIDEIGKNKFRLVILNKSDLADESLTKQWIEFFKEKGYSALSIDSRRGNVIKPIQTAIMDACAEKIERDKKRGIKFRPIRAMVVGVPNVGKSTLINTLAKKAVAKTGNKPGVTKGKQWVRLAKNIELLDTPGILWPKFEDKAVGERLAMTGAIKDDILNIEELVLLLMDHIRENYPGYIGRRYEVEETGTSVELLERIAVRRGCVKKGNETDYLKAADIILDEFRAGTIGRITLEKP